MRGDDSSPLGPDRVKPYYKTNFDRKESVKKSNDLLIQFHENNTYNFKSTPVRACVPSFKEQEQLQKL